MPKKRPTRAERLTPAQEMFCQKYALEPNGAAAYAHAFPASKKWKAKTRAEKASRLLATGNIQARVETLQAEIKKRAEDRYAVTVDRIVGELARTAFSNMLDYIKIQPDGSAYVDFSNLNRDQAAAIGEVVTETYTEGKGEEAREVKRVKFKLGDKRGSLVDLLKHLGAYTERHEHTGKDGKPIEIETPPLSDFELARRVAFLLDKGRRDQEAAAAAAATNGAVQVGSRPHGG